MIEMTFQSFMAGFPKTGVSEALGVREGPEGGCELTKRYNN